MHKKAMWENKKAMYEKEIEVGKGMVELAKKNELKNSESLSKMMQIHQANKQLAQSNKLLKSEIETLKKASEEYKLHKTTNDKSNEKYTQIAKSNANLEQKIITYEQTLQKQSNEIKSLKESNTVLHKDNKELVLQIGSIQKNHDLMV